MYAADERAVLEERLGLCSSVFIRTLTCSTMTMLNLN